MSKETVNQSDEDRPDISLAELAEQKKEELLSGDLSDKDVSFWYLGANSLEGAINYAVIDNKDVAESDPTIVRFEESGAGLNAYIMIEDPHASHDGNPGYMPQSVPLPAAETALLRENMAKAGHDFPDHISSSDLSEDTHLIHAYEDHKSRYSDGKRYMDPVVCFEDLNKGYLDDYPMVHENSDKEFTRHCESYMQFFSHNSKAVELYEQTEPYRVIGVTMETDVNGLYGEHKDGLFEKTDFLQEIAKIQADLPAFADLVAQEEKLFADYGIDMHDYNNDQLGQLVPLMHAGVSKEDFAEVADPALSWIEMKQKKEQLLPEPEKREDEHPAGVRFDDMLQGMEASDDALGDLTGPPDNLAGQTDMGTPSSHKDSVSVLIEEAQTRADAHNATVAHDTVNRDDIQVDD